LRLIDPNIISSKAWLTYYYRLLRHKGSIQHSVFEILSVSRRRWRLRVQT